MKYFSPSYWFKIWLLSAPLFNDETKGINAKSIDNKKIKDWASKNTADISLIENQELSLANNQTSLLNLPLWNSNLTTHNEHHKHPHQKSRNRHKRQNINNSYIEYSHPFLKAKVYYFYFIPEDHDKLINLIRSFEYLKSPTIFNFVNLFKEKFKDMLNTCDNKDNLISEDIRIDGGFWCSLWDFFLDSSFKEKCPNHYTIKIKIQQKNYFSSDWETTNDGAILSENKNKYFDNLYNDFNKELYINTKNIGLIEKNNDILILEEIKKHYPHLNINLFEIFDKKDYSFFSPIFEAKIKPKIIENIDNALYSYCSASKINTKFLYLTQTKLNDISNIISNDKKVKQWLAHINDYNKNLPTKIEQLKTYTDSQKWSAKSTEKEIIKSYIRDWTQISTLIEHDLKLDELNDNIKGIKLEFENIKNQVNELENRIQNLDSRVKDIENTSTWNCVNIAAFGGGYVSVIPTVGTVGSAVGTLISAACAIAGV